jgi:hypothetical protein
MLSRQVETDLLGFCRVSESRIVLLNGVRYDAEPGREHPLTVERLGQAFLAWPRAVPEAANRTR